MSWVSKEPPQNRKLTRPSKSLQLSTTLTRIHRTQRPPNKSSKRSVSHTTSSQTKKNGECMINKEWRAFRTTSRNKANNIKTSDTTIFSTMVATSTSSSKKWFIRIFLKILTSSNWILARLAPSIEEMKSGSFIFTTPNWMSASVSKINMSN